MAISRSYNRMSVAEKQATDRERMREPSVACPACDTQTTATDLLAHVATRCPGPREPSPRSKWISWREAMGLGVNRQTLSRWAKQGDVRFLGDRQERRYLMRDVAVRMAHKRVNRRR